MRKEIIDWLQNTSHNEIKEILEYLAEWFPKDFSEISENKSTGKTRARKPCLSPTYSDKPNPPLYQHRITKNGIIISLLESDWVGLYYRDYLIDLSLVASLIECLHGSISNLTTAKVLMSDYPGLTYSEAKTLLFEYRARAILKKAFPELSTQKANQLLVLLRKYCYIF